MVDLDNAAFESYVKLTEESRPIPPRAPPSFLNSYYSHTSDTTTLESTWQQAKKLPKAAIAERDHSELFTAAAALSLAERKEREAERKKKMQESSISLSFGHAPSYTTTSRMPDHTSHTYLQDVRRQNRERFENRASDMRSSRNPNRFDRQKMAADKILEEAKKKNPHHNLTKSSVVFGEWEDTEGTRKISVAQEGMLLEAPSGLGDDPARWREEAKKKKVELQSTSKGMKLGEYSNTNIYVTDSEFNLKRTIKKKAEQNSHSQDPVSNRNHLKDSVGGLLGHLKNTNTAPEAAARSARKISKHNASSMGSILQHNEDYK